ncbi:MAG: hypothetical protein HYY16_01665, partial [Planctomycetes bacterium]|nr:hypothetical protein [Planctomycetota bacterium]
MHCRCVSLLLSLFLCIPAFAQTQPSTEEKILATLHGQDNRVGIAGYLKARHPAFYQEAVQGGLAEWLDGKIDFQAFRSKLTSNPPLADVLGRVTGGGKLAPPSGPKVADVQTAGALDDPLKMADTLQSSFYQGPRHPLAKILSPQWWKTVGINGGQGKLVWFNPYVDIPELGIKAGEPMTPAQRGALLKLFAVDTTGKSAPGTVGTGFHPKDVGRAVNPNPGVVTILTEQGALVPEIVSKGAGPTSTTSRDGRLDLSEAYMDSEVSRNLQKAGAAVYVPVLVIDIGNDKAIYVRAAGSLLRQGDLSGFSAAEIEGLMNYVMGNRTMNPPAPRVLKTWAEEINPKTIGRNAGLMSGMGLKHGSLSSDNYGLRGELVDWGWAELGHRGSDDQKQYQLDMVEAAVKAANPAIAREEIRSLDRSGLERVATANAMSFAAGDTDDRMRFRLLRRMEGAPSILEGVDRATLELIAKANHVSTYSSDTDVELNERIVKKLQQKRASGLIQGVDRPTLEKIALANGMNVQPNDTDVQISDKLTAEVK